MPSKFFALACIRNNNGERRADRSMPTYTKGVAPQETPKAEVSEAKAVFSVIGMTSSACAGSVEKAVKRLPGIREAVVDVLNNRAQVMFFPSFVNEDEIRKTIEAAVFQAELIKQEANDKSRQVCGIRTKVIQPIRGIAETLKQFLGGRSRTFEDNKGKQSKM